MKKLGWQVQINSANTKHTKQICQRGLSDQTSDSLAFDIMTDHE